MENPQTTTLGMIAELLRAEGIACSLSSGAESTVLIDLSIDSRNVRPGTLFCALRGTVNDGQDFIARALANGASAVLSDRPSGGTSPKPAGPELIVSDVHAALATAARTIFQSRVESLTSFAVTGTNGKTSVAYVLAQAIAELRGSAACFGTLGSGLLTAEGQTAEFIDAKNTTPTSVDLHRFLGQRTDLAGFAVELSSHGLHQRRLEGLELDVAIFMNLTRDHLDYHRTMEEYFEQKRLLFTRDLRASRKARRSAVINVGDEFGRKLVKDASSIQGVQLRTFSSDTKTPADICLEAAALRPDATDLRLRVHGELLRIRSPLIGRYNCENLTAVVAALDAAGVTFEDMRRGLERARPVPGRLEPVQVDPALPTALVDYAHTPDALEKAISSIRELTSGRVLTVFGCGGDRDRGKRPIMGEIAARLSDEIFITSDNPRSEAPGEIIREIQGGIPPERLERTRSVPDRRTAIVQALRAARPGDLVLIAGKGHEPYQEICGVRHPFSDQEVARDALRERL